MLFCGVHAAEQLIKIPFKQDPPISIDGDIADWRDVKCGVIALDGKKDLLKYGNIKNPPEKQIFRQISLVTGGFRPLVTSHFPVVRAIN